MTQDKAREFFSAYYEDSLEIGLRQTLESRLRTDVALRSEYDSFVLAMEALGGLRDEEIEIPSYLSDRIATRLEAVQEKKAASFLSFAWLRTALAGGLACLALAGAFLALKPGAGGVATGSLVPEGDAVAPFQVSGKDGDATLSTPATAERVYLVENGGQTRKVRSAEGHPFSLLTNDNPAAAVFRVRPEAGGPTTLVVVPGKVRKAPTSGEGDLETFGRAISDTYGVTVTLAVARPAERVRWELENTDAVNAATASVSELGLTADLSKSGVLTIQSH